MKQSEMIKSNWLKADDVSEAGTPLTVKALKEQEFKKQSGEVEKKWVASFYETEKELTLNKTNIKTMFTHYPDTDQWAGKQFLFCAREVQDPSGKMVMSIRVSLRKPGKAPANPTAPSEDVPF